MIFSCRAPLDLHDSQHALSTRQERKRLNTAIDIRSYSPEVLLDTHA